MFTFVFCFVLICFSFLDVRTAEAVPAVAADTPAVAPVEAAAVATGSVDPSGASVDALSSSGLTPTVSSAALTAVTIVDKAVLPTAPIVAPVEAQRRAKNVAKAMSGVRVFLVSGDFTADVLSRKQFQRK